MKPYWRILKKYRVSLLISPILVFIGVLCETIQPMFMARIIDDGVTPGDLSIVITIGVYMLLVAIVGLFINLINIYVSSKTSVGFGTDLRQRLFEKIQELSFADIDRFSSSSLITRLTNDITRIQQIVLLMMRLMLRAPMMLVLSVFFVIRIDAQLALILVVSVPLLAISIYFILQKGFPYFLKVQQKVDGLNEVVRENLINIRVVKSFVRENYETKKFTGSAEDLRDTVVKASNIIISAFPVMQFIMNFSIIAILWFGGVKVINGNLQVGELISFVNYLMQVLMSLIMFSMIIMNFARATASSKRILDVINTVPSLENTHTGLENKYHIRQGDLVFENVYFHYEGGEENVLKDISFFVPAGETVAVVGGTGSGKSSLVQLIPRLYDINSGEILIDEVPIKSYNLDELHDKIGVVLQKNELFTGTIADNLRWGKEDATQIELEEAAKAAQAHDFIISFPEGYETMLGRGGVNVSGGQKQRLCIARALLRKPKILILDDSTSAVDTETELKIRNSLKHLLENTTVIMVTQRIATMQSADRVIILDDGQIIANGHPEELLKTSTIYQEIFNSQQLNF